MITLLQGATNSIAQFVRIVIRILGKLFPIIAIPYLDDVRVKGLYTTYSNKETLPGIRRYIYKYILNLDKIIDRIKYVGAYIKAKSQFYYNRMNIVRFIYRYNRRTPSTSKVIKILE